MTRSRTCASVSEREAFIKYITAHGATGIWVGADKETVWWEDPMTLLSDRADEGFEFVEELRHPTTGQTVTEVAREFMAGAGYPVDASFDPGCSRRALGRMRAVSCALHGSTQEMRTFYAAVAAWLSDG